MRNNLHEFKKAVVEEFFDDIKLIIATLGYPVFEKVQTNLDSENTWYCEVRGAKLKGIYDENGLTLLSGSVLASTVTDSFKGIEQRDNLLQELCETGTFITKKDFTFSSPSAAANFGLGRSTNGWTSWKLQDGRTLDEVMRSS